MGINDLSETCVNGKKATQSCPCGHSGDKKHDCTCSGEQIQRYAQLGNKSVDRYCNLGNGEKNLLERAAEKMALSPRGIHRVLKVARTLADLDGEGNIADAHLAEAIAYRDPLKQAEIH